MTRYVYNSRVPTAGKVLPISKGGTSTDKTNQIATNLNLALATQKGAPLGLVPLDAQKKIPVSNFSNSGVGNLVSLEGILSVTVTTTSTFEITDYDSFKTYTVSATRGTASVLGSTVTYTAPLEAGVDTIVVNGRNYQVVVITAIPAAPTIVTPAQSSNTTNSSSSFTSSGFVMTVDTVTDIHEHSDWQLATDINFGTIVKSTANDVNAKTTWNVTNLSPNTTYYLRVRHNGVTSGSGSWSDVRTFSTLTEFVAIAPSITSPTNGATGLVLSPSFSCTAFTSNVVGDTHQMSDWQVATDVGFTTVVKSTTNDAGNKVTWNTTGLLDGTTYYLRVRHKGINTSFSAWSTAVMFVTAIANTITAPTATFNPVASGLGTLATTNAVTGSAFTMSGGSDTHQSTDWQIATDPGFTSIVTQLLASTSNKLSWAFSGLSNNKQYYFRFRYKGNTVPNSPWSDVTVFKTHYATGPVISTPSSGSTNVNPDSITFNCSAFLASGGSDTHQSTDWQVATDSGFTNIVKSTTADAINKLSWTTTAFALNTLYYVRVRHRGATYGIGDWSNVNTFTTFTNYTVGTPTITAPLAGATGVIYTPTVTSSAFSINGGSDTHSSTDWQIAYDAGFTQLAAAVTNGTTVKTSWLLNLYRGNTVHYIRVRHKGSTVGYGPWSPTVSFTTGTFNANQPTVLSPANESTGVSLTPTLSTTFGSEDTTPDVHEMTDWQIATDGAFTNIVKSSLNDTVNKASWTPTALVDSTQYWWRVRYKGTLTNWGPWSAARTFTTGLINTVSTPTITAYNPAKTTYGDSIGLRTIFTSSAFSVTGGGYTHVSTDWQLATDAGFTNIKSQAMGVTTTAGSTSKTSWQPDPTVGADPEDLSYDSIYYLRLRHNASTIGSSQWSSVITLRTYFTEAPLITSPGNNATDLLPPTLTMTTGPFVSSTGTDTHASTSWHLSTSPTFASYVALVTQDTVNKTSFTFTGLALNTTYYARACHHGTTLGQSAFRTISFTTAVNYPVNTPSVTSPTGGATNLAKEYEFTSSAFGTNGGSDTHASSDWQIADSNAFTNVLYSVTNDTVNKTTWTGVNTIPNVTLYVRVRHKSSAGAYSSWSAAVSYTTATSFIPQNLTYSLSAYSIDDGTWGTGEQIGADVCISEDGKTIVASGGYRSNGNIFGSINVYTKSAGIWTKGTLRVNDAWGTGYDIDGRMWGNVAISGDGNRIAITSSNGIDLGQKTIIFVKTDSTWTVEYRIASNPYGSGTGNSSNFNLASYKFDYNGTRLVFNTGPDFSTTQQFVELYARTGSTWNLEFTYDKYGTTETMTSLALSSDGDRLVIGENRGNVNNGSVVKVFKRTGTAWALEQTVINNTWTSVPDIELSIDKNCTKIAVKTNSTANGVNSIYLSTRTGTTWSVPQLIITYDTGDYDLSRTRHVISGDGTIIAVTYHYNTGNDDVVYFYTSVSNWSPTYGYGRNNGSAYVRSSIAMSYGAGTLVHGAGFSGNTIKVYN